MWDRLSFKLGVACSCTSGQLCRRHMSGTLNYTDGGELEQVLQKAANMTNNDPASKVSSPPLLETFLSGSCSVVLWFLSEDRRCLFLWLKKQLDWSSSPPTHTHTVSLLICIVNIVCRCFLPLPCLCPPSWFSNLFFGFFSSTASSSTVTSIWAVKRRITSIKTLSCSSPRWPFWPSSWPTRKWSSTSFGSPSLCR